MENLVTTIALLWVIYIFLFSEADKQLSEFFRRVRFALSIENNGVINLEQLKAKQQLSVDEIIEFTRSVNSEQIHKIGSIFEAKYHEIEQGRNFLISNLFFLSVAVILLPIFLGTITMVILNIWFLTSLILGIAFYRCVAKLPRQRFTQVINGKE